MILLAHICNIFNFCQVMTCDMNLELSRYWDKNKNLPDLYYLSMALHKQFFFFGRPLLQPQVHSFITVTLIFFFLGLIKALKCFITGLESIWAWNYMLHFLIVSVQMESFCPLFVYYFASLIETNVFKISCLLCISFCFVIFM